MTRLPLTTQTLYAELLELLTVDEAERSIGHLQGTIVRKTVRGHRYIYLQYSVPGGGRKQVFVGRQDPALEKFVSDFEKGRQRRAKDLQARQRLCAQLAAGGWPLPDAASGRVLQHLADAGLFRHGVLVGTHAWNLIGGMLGVSWGSWHQTEDIDIAGHLQLAIGNEAVDLPGTLERLKMGFLPVPALNPEDPATSFKVRGHNLRVDLLCPAHSRQTEGPILIPAFKAAAQPLPYLGYLLKEPQRAALPYGSGVLIMVPSPARFALHKLIIARERAATWHTKIEKDLHQAAQLLEVLQTDRPGDLLLAWDDILQRNWQKKVMAGLEAMQKLHPHLGEQIRKALAL
ncbi:MAG: GSU2403 family nucleotidyltransferase fold protein [Geothermobacteraceae bacterium]